MKKLKTGRRAKRSFTPAFKADAVRLVRSGKSASLVAKKLDLTETTLREWAKRADADAGLGSSDVLMTEERAELARLRRDGDGRDRRLHRQLLQHATSSLTSRVRESYRVRIDESDSGTSCIVKLSAEREKVRGRARRAGSKLPDGGGR